MRFSGTRVWLTGASSGIGEALVAPLAERGARVAISARREDRLEAIASAARRRGGEVHVYPLDVTDRAAVAATVASIERDLGGIDLALLNAGGHAPATAVRFDGQQCVETMTVNYFGVVYGIEAVLPGMLARKSGYLAAVASVSGYRPLPAAGAYGASKAAVIHLLNSIRFDLEPYGIRVTVINPGFVKTPLTDRNRFPMPFLMPVEQAAMCIVHGLERERKEIHFPKAMTWTLKTLRVLPYPLYEWIIWHATRGRRLAREATISDAPKSDT
jgi:NADP-dependent 3-hydroxy acid dehydrogenase YdfG